MAGEIELLDTLTLTHLVGHDSDGLAGRSPISSVLSTAYGSAQTSNYTTVATDLNLVVAMQTGTSILVTTLMSAATAGAGSVQTIAKVDSGKGQVRVVDDTGALMGFLTYPNERIHCTPNQSGTGWSVMSSRPTIQPPISGNIYPPYDGHATGGIASGSPLQDLWYVHAFAFDQPRYIDALVLNIGATSAAGLKFKTAMWAYNPATPATPDGATLLSAGAEIGGAGTLTQQAYTSALDTPQWVQRGWVGCKLNTTPAVASLVSGESRGGHVAIVGSTVGRQATGPFGGDQLKGWSYPDAYANAATTLVTGTAIVAAIVPMLALRIG
jgi:hypothetical protein